MGIDIHGLNFLKYSMKLKPLGKVATIGRQQIHISESQIKRILSLEHLNFTLNYCEEMLTSFYQARSVTSFDNDKYSLILSGDLKTGEKSFLELPRTTSGS